MTKTAISRRSDAVQNQARIVMAARTMFAERGMMAEMKDIAEAAGVGVGTIYRNYPKKDDLIADLMAMGIEELGAAFARSEKLEDAVAGLESAVTALYDVVEEYGWLFEAMFSGNVEPYIRDGAKNPSGDNRLQGLSRMLARAREQGAVRTDLDVEFMSAVIGGTIAPWTYKELSANRTSGELAREVLKLVLTNPAK